MGGIYIGVLYRYSFWILRVMITLRRSRTLLVTNRCMVTIAPRRFMCAAQAGRFRTDIPRRVQKR